jgi:hypothetical protein
LFAHRFGASTPFPVGVEEELFLVDPSGHHVRYRIDEPLADRPARFTRGWPTTTPLTTTCAVCCASRSSAVCTSTSDCRTRYRSHRVQRHAQVGAGAAGAGSQLAVLARSDSGLQSCRHGALSPDSAHRSAARVPRLGRSPTRSATRPTRPRSASPVPARLTPTWTGSSVRSSARSCTRRCSRRPGSSPRRRAPRRRSSRRTARR